MCVRSKIAESDYEVTSSNMDARLKLKKQKRKAMQQYQSSMKSGNRSFAANETVSTINQDILALSTEYYRLAVVAVCSAMSRCQDSKAYRILFHTTQPAHLVTLIAVTTVATLVCPFDQSSSPVTSTTKPSPWISFIYLTAFMMHFGAQMWMTFVSGLSLYFAVPRHIFGEVQKVLFPKYFGLNSFLSLVTLIVFVKLNPSSSWDNYIAVQVATMVICFLLELVIRLYLAPPLLQLIAQKNAIEKAAGVGLEVGKHDPGPLAQCPHYIKLHSTFRKIHMTIAIGNILAMVCTCIHLHYLSNKICML